MNNSVESSLINIFGPDQFVYSPSGSDKDPYLDQLEQANNQQQVNNQQQINNRQQINDQQQTNNQPLLNNQQQQQINNRQKRLTNKTIEKRLSIKENMDKRMASEDILQNVRKVNEKKKIRKQWKEEKKKKTNLRKKIKTGEERIEDHLPEEYRNCKKNEARKKEQNTKIFIDLNPQKIKDFFDDTIKNIHQMNPSKPLSEDCIKQLNNRVYLYLEQQGIIEYKSASCQVTALFAVLVFNYYNELCDKDSESGYNYSYDTYKSKFLKQQQRQRYILSSTGLLNELNDGEDEEEELREWNLPSSIQNEN